VLPHIYSQNRPAYSQASTSERNEAACASLRSYRTTDAHQGHRLIKKSALLLLPAAATRVSMLNPRIACACAGRGLDQALRPRHRQHVSRHRSQPDGEGG